MPDVAERTEGQTEVSEASQVASTESTEVSSNDWMNNILRGDIASDTETEVEATHESEDEETAESAPQGSQAATATSQPEVLTRGEVDKLIANAVAQATADFDRKVQAETDRREAARNRKAKAEERQRLRETDPIGFAELDKQEEEEAVKALSEAEKQAQEQTFVQNIMHQSGAAYDRHVLDPFVQALPAPVAQQVFKEIDPDGLEGRSKLVKRAFELLIPHLEKEAETKVATKLRNNAAFRKELLAELRGEEEDPELVTGTVATPPARFDMNREIRSRAGRYTPGRG